MHAKTFRTGLRFFAHAPAPACARVLESVAHHLLELELANAARDAGAHVEIESPARREATPRPLRRPHEPLRFTSAQSARLVRRTDRPTAPGKDTVTAPQLTQRRLQQYALL